MIHRSVVTVILATTPRATELTAHTGTARRNPLALVLAGALSVAGVIHCLLTPEHMAMSALFGAGFLASGVAQFGMAALAVLRPSRQLYAAVIAMTTMLSGLYAYNVFVGLPFADVAAAAATEGHEHADDEHADSSEESAQHEEQAAETDHHEEGLVLGAGEPVDAYGAITQLAQLSAAAIAVALLLRGRAGSA